MDRYKELVRLVGEVVDAFGVLVILGGLLLASLAYARRHRADYVQEFKHYRQNLGRAILLGLEFMVAGDIIRTVAVSPTMPNVLVLGVLVLIRTVLSMSIQVELEGRWPWQAREAVNSNASDRR